MGRWISKKQMAKRRQRVAQLRTQGLSHSEIAERMGMTTGTSERDYKQYNEQILEAKIKNYLFRAKEMGIEGGWLWLDENGFAYRVPAEVRDKIAEYEDIHGGE